jgi:FtsH-binding integral membrane protein
VRASAIRLRRVWLRNKSADQLKRAEIWTWITFGLLFAAAVAVAAVNFNGDRLFYGVLALLSAITLLFSSLTMRRIRRNVALLAGRPQLGRR